MGFVGHVSKAYFSGPLASVFRDKRREHLAGVREALHCMGRCVSFQFHPPPEREYARTVLSSISVQVYLHD